MSQVTLSRAATARPLRSTASPAPRQRLRVVPGAQPAAPRNWFVALCAVLSLGGLLAVLVVNTVMAREAFALTELQVRSAQLADEQEALTNEIDAQKAPARLASRAGSLGMVPSRSVAFVDVKDGKVIGVAEPTTKDGAPTVNASVPADR